MNLPELRSRLLALIADALAQMAASATLEPGLMRLVADARGVLAALDEMDASGDGA